MKMNKKSGVRRRLSAVVLALTVLLGGAGAVSAAGSVSSKTGDQTAASNTQLTASSEMNAQEISSGTDKEASTEDSTAPSSSSSEDVYKLLSGKRAGVITGTPQDQIVKDKVPDAQLQYFNTATDLALALRAGKIDFMVLSDINYYNMASEYPEFGYLDESLKNYDLGIIFPKNTGGQALCDKVNAYIAEIRENGELEKLQQYWLYPREWENIDIP